MNAELDDKQLALLKETLPKLRRVGAMWNPVDPSGSSVIRATELAARALNVQLTPLAVQRPDDVSEAIGNAKKEGVDAVMILGTPDALSAAAPNRRARDERPAADDFRLATIAGGRWTPQLRRQHSRDVPPCG